MAQNLFPVDYFNTTFISSWVQLWVFFVHFRIIFKHISYKYYKKCKNTVVWYLFSYCTFCTGYLHYFNSYTVSVLIPLFCKHNPLYNIYSTLSCHHNSKYDAIKSSISSFGLHRLGVFLWLHPKIIVFPNDCKSVLTRLCGGKMLWTLNLLGEIRQSN